MKVEASVKEVLQETPKVRLVRLTWSAVADFAFKPGQWVGIWCDDFLGENNKPLRRAFSIASSPGEDYVELCIARGKALSAHLQDLQLGAKVWLDGPYGMFWLRPAEKYIFIAGGTGIAPFRPMMKQALDEGKDVTLVYSMKTPSDFIYKAELKEFERHTNCTIVPTITVDEFPEWKGKHGRVQTFLKEINTAGAGIYICGPPAMVEELELHLLTAGHPKDQLFVDKWE